ncbi:MAG: hypothetical protein OQJ89_00590 [Kangiellaceae bacterium]|nr:hypothetical protein [Kangiellaceae bacterium]MCW9000003.1 hypothetical protein [Kangiellaceae bacterium]MCW9015437.1 hypothetical protein [Kangiellaceae bacterium]
MKNHFHILIGILISFSTSVHSASSNTLGAFLGKAYHEEENATLYALEYERRISPHFALGGALEQAKIDNENKNSVVASIFYYPSSHWRFGLGYGIEDTDHGESESILRLSVAYEIHITESISLAPSFSVDQVNGESSNLAGLSASYHF